MAPPNKKRKNTLGASSLRRVDQNRFRSKFHQERFDNNVVNKRVAKEKCFVLKENE